jgi:hypothetical protein
LDNNTLDYTANKALAFNSNIEYSVLEIDDLENFKEKKLL